MTEEPKFVERLQWAITAALSSPLLDDIQGFAWEAVFHYAKGLPLRDPLRGKSKRLFDAVDANTKTGWSLKAKECGSKPSTRCGKDIDFVIQRADIYSKAVQLGYAEGLSREDDPTRLGHAIVTLWNAKVEEDKAAQTVVHPKLAMLLKSRNRRSYGYFEIDLPVLNSNNLTWKWIGKGLRGYEDGQVRLRWHQSGKQLFQLLPVPDDSKLFSVEPRRIAMDAFVQFIANLAYGQTLS